MLDGYGLLNEVLNNRYSNIPESTYLKIGIVTSVKPLSIRDESGFIEVKRMTYGMFEREKTRGTKDDTSLKVGDNVLILVFNQEECFLIEKLVRIG